MSQLRGAELVGSDGGNIGHAQFPKAAAVDQHPSVGCMSIAWSIVGNVRQAQYAAVGIQQGDVVSLHEFLPAGSAGDLAVEGVAPSVLWTILSTHGQQQFKGFAAHAAECFELFGREFFHDSDSAFGLM